LLNIRKAWLKETWLSKKSTVTRSRIKLLVEQVKLREESQSHKTSAKRRTVKSEKHN